MLAIKATSHSPRLTAAAALVTVIALATTALLSAPQPRTDLSPDSYNDVELFGTIASRLRGGEGYYAVSGQEMRLRGYPTGHPFNWRTPLHLSAIASVPPTVAAVLWACLGAVLVLTTAYVTFKSSLADPIVVIVATFMQVGFVLTLSPVAMSLMAEAWSGALLGLSALGFVVRRSRFAITLGLAALFCRELAAPFCVACGLMAITRRRWYESAAWISGAASYAIYYALHVNQVRSHVSATDRVRELSWIRFDGFTFLLATIKWHFWLHFTSTVVVALVFSLICAGIMSSRTPWMIRLTASIYGVFFMAIGLPFNQYWGLVAWPVWAVASGFGASALWRWTHDVITADVHPRFAS